MSNDDSEDKTKEVIRKYGVPILYTTIGFVALLIFSVIVTEGANIITNVFREILRWFKIANLRPSDSKGFAAFVRLLAIAIFVGWTINRFKKKK